MLTLRFIRNCKIKNVFHHVHRQVCIDKDINSETNIESSTDGEDLLEFQESWPQQDEPALRSSLARDMTVIPNFISEHEENDLVTELEPYLKRMRYEFDHWDNAIQGYRETERSAWSSGNAAVLARVRGAAFCGPGAGAPLPHHHVLDLAAAGHIKPHIDAVRFCGEVIAGLCLLSSAVMRLEHQARPELAAHALLARRGLYIMRGVARHSFTHAVLGAERSVWRGRPLPRRRRLAIITRSQPARAD